MDGIRRSHAIDAVEGAYRFNRPPGVTIIEVLSVK